MKGLATKQVLVAAGIVLCLALLCVFVFPGYVAAAVGPSLERAKSHRVLAAAKTPDELRAAVGSWGRFFPLKDGSWVAVRYRDSHPYPGYSCAVALDSDGHWFHSSRHFCGRFRNYDQIQKQTRQLATALGDEDAALQKALSENDRELYDLATANTLAAARSQLLKIGFSE
jgi:hypothetical protein